MVKNDTSPTTDWRLFAGRLFTASLGMVLGVALLGAVHHWPMWASDTIAPTLAVAGLGLALWSSLPVRSRLALVCFLGALIVLGLAFCLGVIGLFYVACATGQCISLG